MYILSNAIINIAIGIISLVIAVYFSTLRKKDRSTWMFLFFFLVNGIFFLRNAVHFSILDYDLSKYTEPGIMLLFIGLFFIVPFSLFFHRELSRKFTTIFLTMGLVLLISEIVACVNYTIINQNRFFRFSTDYFTTKDIGAIIGIPSTLLTLLPLVIFLIKTVRFSDSESNVIMKIISPKGRYSRACRNFALTIIFQFVIALVGLFSSQGFLKYETNLFLTMSLSLLLWFIYILLYFHNSPQPSTVIVKIVGISLVTILSLLASIGLAILNNERENYDEKRIFEISIVKDNIEKNKDKINLLQGAMKAEDNVALKEVMYIASRPVSDGLFSDNYTILYNKSENVTGDFLKKSDDVKRETDEITPEIESNIGKLPTMVRMNRLGDLADIKTFYTYYNFIVDENLYEVGYSYISYREKLHASAMKIAQTLVILTIALIVIFPLFFRSTLIKPLDELLDGVKKVNDGDLSIVVPFTAQDEVGYLAASFNNMVASIKRAQSDLKDYADTLEDKVDQRTEELNSALEELEAINENLRIAKELAESDMDMAANVQKALLPKEAPKTQDWDISFFFKPMSGVSGDLYDFYIKDGGLKGLTICDVSGHGIASGLVTMIARSVFLRIFERNYDKNLNSIISKINSNMIREIGNVDNYLTSILLRFKDNTVEYVNAGHPDLLFKSSSSGKARILNLDDRDVKGRFIGLAGMDDPFRQLNFNMSEGDTLLLYTDCLSESKNKSGEEYGPERVLKSLERAPDGSAQKILDSILNDFNSFSSTKIISDDLTVIVLKYIKA